MTTKELDEKAWLDHPYTWRNNRGSYRRSYTKKDGTTSTSYIYYGIPTPPRGKMPDKLKGGDRIGFTEIKVTPDMIGKKLAVFTSLEIKGEGDKLVEGQIDWHNFVLKHGGISKIYDNGEVVDCEINLEMIGKKITMFDSIEIKKIDHRSEVVDHEI